MNIRKTLEEDFEVGEDVSFMSPNITNCKSSHKMSVDTANHLIQVMALKTGNIE